MERRVSKMKKLVLLVVFVFFLSFGKVILAETCSPTWVSLDKIYTGAIFLNIGKDNKPMVLYTEYIKTGSVNGSRFLKCTSNDCKSFNDINFDGLFQWWSGGAGNFSDGSVAFVMVTNNMDMYFVKCSDDKCSNYTKILFKRYFMDRDNNYEIKLILLVKEVDEMIYHFFIYIGVYV